MASAPSSTPPAPAAPRPRLAFLDKHALRYGLEVTARDAETDAVTSAVCLFCRHFGREERPGKKRKASATIKYFRCPFRTDQYVQHLTLQHRKQWEAYKASSDDAKREFFPVDLTRPEPDKQKVVDTKVIAEAAAAAKVSEVEKHCWFLVPKRIVDLVVPVTALGGGRGWRPANFRACEVVELTKAQTGRVQEAGDSEKEQYYRAAIFTRMEFDVALDAVASGLSPRQASQHLAALARRTTGAGGAAPSFPLLKVEEMRELVRLMVSESLQLTGKFLERCWGFGLVLREVTAAPTVPRAGYLDVRVVVYVQATLCDVHVIALPLFERHTAFALAQAIECVLDAVFPMWRSRVLGVTQNGCTPIGTALNAGSPTDQPGSAAPSASSFSQRSVEVLSFLEASIKTSTPTIPRRVLYSTWGACRQVSLALSTFYDSLLGRSFLPVLRDLTAYIRRHPLLMYEMGERPSVSVGSSAGADTLNDDVDLNVDAAWMAMGLDTQWITDKRVRLRKHLAQQVEAPSSSSSSTESGIPVDDVWWVTFFVVHWVSTRANEAFQNLRLPRISRASQAQTIKEMIEELAATFKIQGQQQAEVGQELLYFSRQGKFSILKSSVHEFLGDQGIFVSNVVARVSPAALDVVLESLSICLVNLAEAMTDLSTTPPEAEAEDEALMLPPVLPHDLAQLSGREFTALLQRHGGQLRTVYSDEALDIVEQEYQALHREVMRETELKAAMAQCDEETPFTTAWAITKNQFPLLQAYAGGLASAYAGRDASSKKSLVGLALGASSEEGSEDDGLGLAVTDFVLEATLHAQQFDAISALYQEGS